MVQGNLPQVRAQGERWHLGMPQLHYRGGLSPNACNVYIKYIGKKLCGLHVFGMFLHYRIHETHLVTRRVGIITGNVPYTELQKSSQLLGVLFS